MNNYLSQKGILQVINRITIFASLGVHEQNMLAEKCHVTNYQKEEIVIEQGDVGDILYAVIKGQVIVSKRSVSQGWVTVSRLGPGEVFGEIAILRNVRRTARVTTETPCTFLTISKEDFLQIYQYFPARAHDDIQLVVAKRLAAVGRL
jgi:CRP-like cAMP-binding protein